MKRIFILAVMIFCLTDLSFAQSDSDSDGVFDSADLCEGTVFPESVPWAVLGPGSFALTNNDTIFDTTVHCGQSDEDSSYSLNDTCGCSCEQVLSIYYRNMYSQGSYHSYFEMYIYKYLQLNFGCRRSVLDDFIEENCPADNEPVSCNGILQDEPSVCSGNGVCDSQDVCVCEAGWEGEWCEEKTPVTCDGVLETDPNVCSGHGECVGVDTCNCDPDYQGDDSCEEEETGGDEKTGTVMYDFEGTDEEELSVSEGDTVTILKDLGEWLFVRASDGAEGYVPTTYVQQQ